MHPKYRTPHVGTVITGVVAAMIAGLLPINVLGELVSIGTLLAFATVCIGVLVLRYTRPDLPRPFRVPAPWFVCIVGALICVAHDALAAASITWLRLLIWTVIGFAIYFATATATAHLRAARIADATASARRAACAA